MTKGEVLVERFYRTVEDSIEFADEHGEEDKNAWQFDMAERKESIHADETDVERGVWRNLPGRNNWRPLHCICGGWKPTFSVTGSDDHDELWGSKKF